jgi:hypothetical protein
MGARATDLSGLVSESKLSGETPARTEPRLPQPRPTTALLCLVFPAPT